MPQDPPPFAELYCRSNFTFLVGASQPEELVRRAAAKLYTSIAITDECSVSGVVRAHLMARECGIHFIVGSEIALTTEGGNPYARVVVLAQDRRGYGNLSELITLARRRAEKGSYSALVADVEGKTSKAPQLAGMPGCIVLLIPDPEATVESLFAQAMWLRTWFPDRAWLAGARPAGNG
jgi:error-prone DNA polymerase